MDEAISIIGEEAEIFIQNAFRNGNWRGYIDRDCPSTEYPLTSTMFWYQVKGERPIAMSQGF